MKALEFINFLLKETEGAGTVEFHRDEDRMEFCERFFGVRPQKDIPAGFYVWIYSDLYDLPELYRKLAADPAAIRLPVTGDCDIWLAPLV